MSEAEEARFSAFVEATDEAERDWIAFCEFEDASRRAAMCAGMINLYDADEHGQREQDQLRLALSEMLFRVLPKVDLGEILACVEGIGYAIRYGLIAPKADALDGIADTDGFAHLAERGYAADQADSDRRLAEVQARPKKARAKGR